MIDGHQQALRADEPAGTAGAGSFDHTPRRHLSERGAGRDRVPDAHRRASASLIARSIILPLRRSWTAMHAVSRRSTTARSTARRRATRSARWRARSRSFAKMPSPSARRRTSCAPRRSAPKKRLDDLREAQQNLIAAEKLAALGGLVAGVAHEVNNPIGISLTVASSFARRCDDFAKEVAAGPLRRSRLDEFLDGGKDAANQFVANLQRAGELVQSFKQVAVDRSHADRRQFDLRESTDQIIASLRPVLKKSQIALTVDVPTGVIMDSYPGSYGQVLTNLFLNSVIHAFPDGRAGSVIVEARQVTRRRRHLRVRRRRGHERGNPAPRADPFFTTRRNEGGTGLGLHIIFNLVTQQLGGRLTFESSSAGAPGSASPSRGSRQANRRRRRRRNHGQAHGRRRHRPPDRRSRRRAAGPTAARAGRSP